MSESSVVKKPKPLLGDTTYNVVKRSATIILPALATLYLTLAQVWNFPEPEKVVTTITALNTFLGVVVQISKKSYYASGQQYAGEIQVQDMGDRKVASLVVDGDPEDILAMKEATFKIADTGENPVVHP
ncbi:holin [Streptomyces phage Kardashian]|nr:holin [Streptomyces phage Kardashian]